MSKNAERARLLLADDHTFFLRAAVLLLEERYEIVGTVRDGRTLLTEAVRLTPDLILLDIGMPKIDGIEAAAMLRRIMPEAKLVFLTGSDNPEIARKALRTDAAGFLVKHAEPDELFRAIDCALAGRKPYVSDATAHALDQLTSSDGNGTTLTDRQRQVLKLLARGMTMKEVASTLHLTPRAIADHKYRIMAKLGAANNAELLRYAFRHRLA